MMLDKQRNDIIEEFFPAFSDKRKQVRKDWNDLLKTVHIGWDDYLFYRTIKEAIEKGINPYWYKSENTEQ